MIHWRWISISIVDVFLLYRKDFFNDYNWSTSNRNNEVSYIDDSVVTMIIYINIDDTLILKPPVTTLRYKTDTFEDVQ